MEMGELGKINKKQTHHPISAVWLSLVAPAYFADAVAIRKDSDSVEKDDSGRTFQQKIGLKKSSLQ